MALPNILVSTDWLAQNLHRENLQIVDIRGYVKTSMNGSRTQTSEYVGAPDEFETEHMPGAGYIDWTFDIIDPLDSVPVQIANPAQFAATMEAKGVGDNIDVVIVDHTGGHFATRLWWALRYYGHQSVAVLDGGFAKWKREDRPLTSDPASPKSVTPFTPRQNAAMRVTAEDLLAASAAGTRIVDARDLLQYTGEVYRGSRAGHVPGAVSLLAKSLFSSEGTWKSTAELAQVFATSRVDLTKPVIAYCNGGVTATAVLFAMELLGATDYANYDGSWNEWGERFDLPVQDDYSDRG